MNRKIGLTLLVTVCFVQIGMAQNTLDFYLKAAKENSPVVKENISLQEKALIQKKRIEAEYHGPKVYASGEVNYSPLLPDKDDPKAVGYDVAITDGGLIAANVNVLQPILNTAVRESLIKQNEATAQSGIVQSEINLHQIEKEVTDQYILSYESRSQLEYSKNIKEQLQRQKEIVETLAKSGLYKSSDVILLDIEIQNQTVQISQMQSVYNQNIFSLYSLCGIKGQSDVELTQPNLQINEAVFQSKFLDRYRSDSLKEVLNLQVSNLKYKPQVSLYGNTGLMSTGLSGIQRKFGAAIGLTVSVPIYDGHQKNYNQEQSDINLQVIDNYKQDFLIRKNNRKQAILSSLNLIDKRIEVINSQLQNYE